MKILITGINGFIGKHIAGMFCKKHDIIGIDLGESFVHNDILIMDYFCVDISNYESYEQISKKYTNIDAIIHLAACIDKNNNNPVLISANIIGTQNCIRFAHEVKCTRFIYFSSVPVIGKPVCLPITEEHPTFPNTAYHATKLFGEYILSLTENSILNPIIFRIPSPAGPGMNPKTILPVFLDKCIKNELIELYGEGKRRQNYLDVRDICSAVEKGLISDICGIINLGNDNSISNIDLAYICKRVTGSSSEIKFNGISDPEEEFHWDICIDKARKSIMFYPRYNMEDTILSLLKETN